MKKDAGIKALFLALLLLVFILGYLVGTMTRRFPADRIIPVSSETIEPVQPLRPDPAPDPIPQAEEPPAPREPTPDHPLDLNLATQEELDLLPGIGPSLAARIVDYRNIVGSFQTLEQLMEVSGIGEKKFSTLLPLITIGGTP